MPNDSQVTALVLAAGFGSRLKSVGKKPLLLYNGKTFVEQIIEKLLAIKIETIILITNKLFEHDLKRLDLPAKTIINRTPERGMLSSIILGLAELPENNDGFFLCSIDYSLVKIDTYQTLLSTFLASKNSIIKPQCLGRSGHPIIIPQMLSNALKLAPLVEGARFVTKKYSHQTIFVNVNDPGILLNINTPQLYKKYCEKSN
jgi:CTP:molybdopterin cytidylyltransferase MocA